MRGPFSLLTSYLRNSIIAVVFLSKYYLLRTSVGHALYCLMKDLRYDTEFRTSEINFHQTAYANPEHIRYKINQDASGYQYTQVGRIETGDFPESAVLVENYYVYTSLYQHFVNGRSWEETPYYTMAFDHINATDLGWGQIPDYEALDEFFTALDELYHSIESRGYVESRDLISEDSWLASVVLNPIWEHNEVFIDIGRRGELLLVDGRHRVAIAKILSINEIPVRILARHREWCTLRNDIIQFIETENSLESKYPICHPEFSHIEYRYDPTAVRASIRELAKPNDGPIIEYAPGASGKLLHELGNEGYDVIGVTKDEEQKRYIEWYTEYEDITLETHTRSQFDGDISDCTVIALDPIERAHVRELIEVTDANRLITNDSRPYQGSIDGGVDIIELSSTIRAKTV